jgi:hypothetical protein
MEECLGSYMKTCLRYEKEEVPKNECMKRPYFERNIIHIYLEYDKKKMEEKVHNHIMNFQEMGEDDFYRLCWLSPSLRKKRDLWETLKSEVKVKVFVEKMMVWMIRYFQFYMISTEFLYSDHNLFKEEIQILYHPKKTQKYLKKNKKKIEELKRFVFLYNEILDLQIEFEKISLLMIEIFSNDQMISFSQFAFFNITLFERDIIPQKEKKKWISSFTCMSNFTE